MWLYPPTLFFWYRIIILYDSSNKVMGKWVATEASLRNYLLSWFRLLNYLPGSDFATCIALFPLSFFCVSKVKIIPVTLKLT